MSELLTFETSFGIYGPRIRSILWVIGSLRSLEFFRGRGQRVSVSLEVEWNYPC